MAAFKRAFEIFDADGSGKMNFSEMDKLIMEVSGKDPTDEEVILVIAYRILISFIVNKKCFKLMKQFDTDESGMVEFAEFVRVMAKRAEESKIKKKEKEFQDAFKVGVNMNFYIFSNIKMI